MKKILLATTAAVGVAAFAQSASAQMTVTLGGSLSFQAGAFIDLSRDGATRDFEFRTNTELLIRADGKADNGLTYGAIIEIEADQGGDTGNGSAADEANIYIGGGWGRLELGDQDGASEVLSIYAPANYGTGGLDGDYGEFLTTSVNRGATGNTGYLNDFGGAYLNPRDTSDATKITYYTPVFAGFQAGVSYAPTVGNGDGQTVVRTENIGLSDFVELAARYNGEFGAFSVGVSGTYNFAEAATGREDISAWGLGASVGYAGFTLAGAYVHEGESNQLTAAPNKDDVWGWNVGLEYATGPFVVGAQYQYTEDPSGTGIGATGQRELHGYSIGATYTVAPGLTTFVEGVWYDIEDGDAAVGVRDTDGQVVIVGTRVAF